MMPWYWCWVGNGPLYEKEQIFGEIFWILLTIFVSTLAYIPLSLWARGNLSVHPGCWWKIRLHHVLITEMDDASRRKRRTFGMIAYVVIFSLFLLKNVYSQPRYPLAYTGMVLPMATYRLIAISNNAETFPPAVLFAV